MGNYCKLQRRASNLYGSILLFFFFFILSFFFFLVLMKAQHTCRRLSGAFESKSLPHEDPRTDSHGTPHCLPSPCKNRPHDLAWLLIAPISRTAVGLLDNNCKGPVPPLSSGSRSVTGLTQCQFPLWRSVRRVKWWKEGDNLRVWSLTSVSLSISSSLFGCMAKGNIWRN